MAAILFGISILITYRAYSSRQYIPADPTTFTLPKEAIALTGKDAFGRKFPKDVANFRLLVLPSCQACSIKHLDFSRLELNLSRTIVIISSRKGDLSPKLDQFIRSAPYAILDPWPTSIPLVLERYAPAIYILDENSNVTGLEIL